MQIIDVNSIAANLGEIQEITNSNNHKPIEFFVNKDKKFFKDDYKEGMRYIQILDTYYRKKFSLEGNLTFNKGRIKDISKNI